MNYCDCVCYLNEMSCKMCMKTVRLVSDSVLGFCEEIGGWTVYSIWTYYCYLTTPLIGYRQRTRKLVRLGNSLNFGHTKIFFSKYNTNLLINEKTKYLMGCVGGTSREYVTECFIFEPFDPRTPPHMLRTTFIRKKKNKNFKTLRL